MGKRFHRPTTIGFGVMRRMIEGSTNPSVTPTAMAYVSAWQRRWRSLWLRTSAGDSVETLDSSGDRLRLCSASANASLFRFIVKPKTIGVITAPVAALTRSHAAAGFVMTRLDWLNILDDSRFDTVIKAEINAKKAAMNASPSLGAKHCLKKTVKKQISPWKTPLSELQGWPTDATTLGSTEAKQPRLIPTTKAGTRRRYAMGIRCLKGGCVEKNMV
jgi:hypothetical protein